MKRLFIFLIISIGVIGSFSHQDQQEGEEKATYDNITVVELYNRLTKGDSLVLLDVRTPEEFNGPLGHLEGAILIPVQELEFRMDELKDYQIKEIIVYCRSGHRSRIASEWLSAHGFHVTNLEGGMKAWNALVKSLPEKEEKKVNP